MKRRELLYTAIRAGSLLSVALPEERQAEGINNGINAQWFPGVDAAQKIIAAAATLPTSGGTIDLRGLIGAQVFGSDPFIGITAPCTILMGSATFTSSVNITVPANVNLMMLQGAVISMNAGTTLMMHGGMEGSSLSQHFAGVGAVTMRSMHILAIYPQWWGAQGTGVDDTAAITAAWNALPLFGQAGQFPNAIKFVFPPGYYVTSNTLNPKGGVIVEGAGRYATQVVFNGSGAFWLDAPNYVTVHQDASADHFVVRDMTITIQSPAIGWLRANSPSTNAAGVTPQGWTFTNLFVQGPGAGVVGTIGMSWSLMIDYRWDHVTISDFETTGIIDRAGNGTFTRVRWVNFKYGLWHTGQAGTGTAMPSGADVFIGCEFLGPTVPGGGDTFTVQSGGLTMINCLYEAEPPNVSQALIHVKTDQVGGGGVGENFVDINGTLSVASTSIVTNLILLDNGFASPKFYGTGGYIPGPPFSPISMGTPRPGYLGARAYFQNCSGWVNQLVQAADPTLTRTVIVGQMDNQTVFSQSQIRDQTGLLRLLEVSGWVPVTPPAGKGLEIWMDSSTSTGRVYCYDRSGSAYLPLYINASPLHCTFDLSIDNGGLTVANATTLNSTLAVTGTSQLTGALTANAVTVNGVIHSPFYTLAVGSATPSVAAGNLFVEANPTAVTITNFTSPTVGQRITIVGQYGVTTVANNPNIVLKGGANALLGVNQSISLIYVPGGAWVEVARSF
jgi:hypothetical protein